MLKSHLFIYLKNITIAKFNRPVLSCFNFIIPKKAFKKNHIYKKMKEKIDKNQKLRKRFEYSGITKPILMENPKII